MPAAHAVYGALLQQTFQCFSPNVQHPRARLGLFAGSYPLAGMFLYSGATFAAFKARLHVARDVDVGSTGASSQISVNRLVFTCVRLVVCPE